MCLGLYVVVTEVHVTVMALHVTLRIVACMLYLSGITLT